MLEGYSSWLENRVVSRFDAAIVEGNYPQQAQVVAIMTELDKEKSIAKVEAREAHQQPCLSATRGAPHALGPTSSLSLGVLRALLGRVRVLAWRPHCKASAHKCSPA